MPEPEAIPSEDELSRLVEAPRTYNAGTQSLILETLLEFPGGEAECVVWRKYAVEDAAVHALGKEWEDQKSARQIAAKGDSKMKYVGFISTTMGAITGIRTQAGHGFQVIHDPEPGPHHVEISFLPAADAEFIKSHKAELRLAIRKVFGPLVPAP